MNEPQRLFLAVLKSWLAAGGRVVNSGWMMVRRGGEGRKEERDGQEHRSSRVGGHGLGQGPVRTAHEEEANGRYAEILLQVTLLSACRSRGQRLLVCQDDDIRSPPNGQLAPPP